MPDSPNSLEQRVVELERRLALHERMAEELSTVVAEQASLIETLNARTRALTGRVLAFEDAAWEGSPQDDKPPPHY
jgi:SlyX protein